MASATVNILDIGEQENLSMQADSTVRTRSTVHMTGLSVQRLVWLHNADHGSTGTAVQCSAETLQLRQCGQSPLSALAYNNTTELKLRREIQLQPLVFKTICEYRFQHLSLSPSQRYLNNERICENEIIVSTLTLL